jgi:hypothetical protein
MPHWKKVVQDRIAPLYLPGTAESDLSEELAHHLEDRYRELRGGGATEEEAYQSAVSELNDMHPLLARSARMQPLGKHQIVPAGGVIRGNFVEDLKGIFAIPCALCGKSLFVLFVVLTLALGIGANTTVFTVINTLI